MAVIIDKYNRILKERDAELRRARRSCSSAIRWTSDYPAACKKKIYAFVLLYKGNLRGIRCRCHFLLSAGPPCSWASGPCPARPTAFWPTWAHRLPARAICTAQSPWRCCPAQRWGKNPPFFGEFTVRHPEDKNVELLWHCGPFAYSLKKPGTIAREENQRQWFQVKDGKFTICRFDQDDGHYQLLNGTLESADGPYTFGTYLWARFNDLTKWERKDRRPVHPSHGWRSRAIIHGAARVLPPDPASGSDTVD